VDGVLGHRTAPGEDERAAGGRHAGAVLEVLDADGHAGERPGVAPGGQRGVDRLGRRAGQALVDVHERAQALVARGDGGQRLVEHLDGPPLAAAHRLRDLDR
jgi:hypothetical protein